MKKLIVMLMSVMFVFAVSAQNSPSNGSKPQPKTEVKPATKKNETKKSDSKLDSKKTEPKKMDSKKEESKKMEPKKM